MVKNHVCHTLKPKYLLEYNILKILSDSTLMLITPNGKERKANINDVKPCSRTELIKKCSELIFKLNKNKTSKLQ